jgi:hypothetical protein
MIVVLLAGIALLWAGLALVVPAMASGGALPTTLGPVSVGWLDRWWRRTRTVPRRRMASTGREAVPATDPRAAAIQDLGDVPAHLMAEIASR